MTINRHWAGKAGFFAAALGVLMLLLSTAAVAQPTLVQAERNASPGDAIDLGPADVFENTGTNPRFTGATFSNPEYLNNSGFTEDSVSFDLKTADELNAMSPRPRSHFRFTVQVHMTNDEGWGTVGTLTYLASYPRAPDTVGGVPGQPTAPVLAQTLDLDAPPGERVETEAGDMFAYAGTNPRFTAATFSTTDYYNTGSVEGGVLVVQAKTDAELNDLEPRPESVFRVTVDVTMTNDEGQTGTGTLTFVTGYRKSMREGAPPPPMNEGNPGQLPDN